MTMTGEEARGRGKRTTREERGKRDDARGAREEDEQLRQRRRRSGGATTQHDGFAQIGRTKEVEWDEKSGTKSAKIWENKKWKGGSSSFDLHGIELDLTSSHKQRIIIDALNLVFLILFLLFILVGFIRKHSNRVSTRKDWVFLVTSLCCAAIAVAHFCVFLWVLIEKNDSRSQMTWLIHVIRAVIWIALAVSAVIRMTIYIKIMNVVWWIMLSILGSAVNVEVLVKSHKIELLDAVTWLVSLFLLLCSFRLLSSNEYKNYGNDQGQDLSEPLIGVKGLKGESPIKISNFLSQLTFSWLNPLLSLGYSKPLALDDIPSLVSEDEALIAYQMFVQAWTPLIGSKKSSNENRNLVITALAKVYLKESIVVGIYSFLRTLSVVVSPLLLYAFVKYSSNKEASLIDGIKLVGYLVVVKVVESLSQRHWFFNSRRSGMRMRSALQVAVYDKLLKLSSLGRRRHSTGEIVNYIAVDAYRMGESLLRFHSLWNYALQLFLAIGVLFVIVGIGALPGLVPIFICGLLNVPFAKLIQNCQLQFMIGQDERLRATSEVLNNMKVIKLQSWEEKFKHLIESLREVEFKWLAKSQIMKSYGTALYWMSPTVISAVVFIGCILTRSASLNASTIFTILATLRSMSEPVRMIPEALSMIIQVKVSLDRLNTFLLDDELKEQNIQSSDNSSISVRINDGYFRWNQDIAEKTLEDIDLEVSTGEKVAICGPVGSGKSSLLHAILGEIPKISGSVSVYGSIAYVSQTSWIQSGTIRDNILYGKPMEMIRYKKAIKACALDKDIDSFDHGDLTEIGQRGLNLSGGQKQRIQLARAVYNDADIYLLDDPFSAVDAHTAAILFNYRKQDCVMDALQNKTVILVTHQVEFLTEANRILVMEGGRVTQSGSYQDLLTEGMSFEQLVNAHKNAITMLDTKNNVNWENQAQKEDQSSRLYAKRENSDGDISVCGKAGTQLTEDEEMEIGDVGWKPIKDYIVVSSGFLFLGLSTLSQCAFVAFQAASTYWLAIANQIPQISSGVLIGVYTVISGFSAVFVYFRSYFAALLGLKASKSFFLASSDLSVLDYDIPYSIAFVIAPAIDLVATIGIMASVTWPVLIVAILAMVAVKYVQGYYLASARELIRINGTTKAPIMNYTSETSLGLVTIRAFAMKEKFFQNYLKLVDTDASLFFHSNATMEWLLLRVEALQNVTLIAATLLLVMLPHGSVATGFVGLSLSYALALTSTQVFLTRWYCNLANYIISVERIKQFIHLQQEPPAIVDDKRPPPAWPSKGRIDLQDLKIKYRPNAPLVLKGITCTFKDGTRVGVVGRTGSGKTTLISALFRLVEPASGSILIDGLDICSIGLRDLRLKLSIIPQEPTLFRGTVRTNMDPLGLYSDEQIWEALEKCQLKTTISSLPNLLDSYGELRWEYKYIGSCGYAQGLKFFFFRDIEDDFNNLFDPTVSDEGENWSSGQRQLFCLGRILLKRNRILVLDEATASIDSATDATLQRVIREEFSNCTVITVAHRVPTVIDSDMVMVLSYGVESEIEFVIDRVLKGLRGFGEMKDQELELELNEAGTRLGDPRSSVDDLLRILDNPVQLLMSRCYTEKAIFGLKGGELSLLSLDMVIEEILKHEWSARWQSFVPDLVSTAKTSETICENCMAILKVTSISISLSSGTVEINCSKDIEIQGIIRPCTSKFIGGSLHFFADQEAAARPGTSGTDQGGGARTMTREEARGRGKRTTREEQGRGRPATATTTTKWRRDDEHDGFAQIGRTKEVEWDEKGGTSAKIWENKKWKGGSSSFDLHGIELDLTSSHIQRIIIDALNLVFLILFLLFILVGFIRKHSNRVSTRKDWVFLVTSLCCAAIAVAHFCVFLWDLIEKNDSRSQMTWLIHVIRAVIWIALAVSAVIRMTIYIKIMNVVWWIMLSILGSAVNVEVLVKSHKIELLDAVTWLVSLFLLLCSFRLLSSNEYQNYGNDQGQDLSEPLIGVKGLKGESPIKISNFLSQLTFSWLNPLLSLGYSKPLALDDIPSLVSEDEALIAYQMFVQAWTPLIGSKKSSNENRNLVITALAKVYLKESIVVGIYSFLRTLSVVVSPLLLYAFVKYSSNKEASLIDGIKLVGYLVVVKVVESMSQRHWFFNSRRSGMRMRSALQVAVYDKLLKLSSLGLNQAQKEDQSSRLYAKRENSDGDISVCGKAGTQLTEDEEMEIGDVGWKPIKDYIVVSSGFLFLGLSTLSQCAFVAFQAASTYWLAIANQIPQISSGVLIGVYTVISGFSAVFVYFRSYFAALLGLKASKSFFSGFTNSVFGAPMLFFDSTPIGRILTRASSDLSVLDYDIPYSIAFVIAPAIDLVATIGIMASVTWPVLIVAILAMVAVKYVQGYYLASARELIRINGTTKAPIMNYTSETSLGLVTIRAFAMKEKFFQNYLKLVDTDASLFFHSNATMEWLLLRVEALQNVTLIAATILLVMLPHGSVATGFVGLSLSYALALTSTQVFLTRWYCNLANYIISVERIKQFIHLQQEPPAIVDDKRPPPAWPSKGRIDLQDLKIKYRPNAPLVLKGITCTFKDGTRVGVVGRTGSGKTTLISALFRLVEPASGSILIDGLDICSIGLRDLRLKLSIIPQEPTLFRGTVRTNMDPLGLYSDEKIWEALEKCQLKTTISSLPNLLDSYVSDEGENWSSGQRQLFCLGRVLLKRNRILVLDEATASIDSATDATLQRVIREEFSNCTVITVAHRVPTVIDSDMVMAGMEMRMKVHPCVGMGMGMGDESLSGDGDDNEVSIPTPYLHPHLGLTIPLGILGSPLVLA
ncbi:hypothetical protein Syun_026200 [Stephania yunnanensis]|uniref:ABC transporter C family member 8 n=1 Tax=Stephania yunnanensis TaxID=152371 RepID=A0AAP0EVQ2_9MAGN